MGLFSSVMNLSDTSQPKAEGHSDRCMPTLDAVNVGRKVAAAATFKPMQAYDRYMFVVLTSTKMLS